MSIHAQTINSKRNMKTHKSIASSTRLEAKEMIANLLSENEDEKKVILEIANFLPFLLKGKKYREITENTARDIFLEIGFEGTTTTAFLETLHKWKRKI